MTNDNYRVVLLGEQSVSKAGGVGSNPTVPAERPCDAAGVAACLSRRRDGFESHTGRFSTSWGRTVRHPSDTRVQVGSTPTGWISTLASRLASASGCMPAGFRLWRADWRQPAGEDRLDSNSLVEQRSARHPDMVEIAGSNPAGTTDNYSRGPAATAPPSHGEDRRFESCREVL